MDSFTACVYVQSVWDRFLRRSEGVIGSPRARVTDEPREGAGNQIQVPCKSNKYSNHQAELALGFRKIMSLYNVPSFLSNVWSQTHLALWCILF